MQGVIDERAQDADHLVASGGSTGPLPPAPYSCGALPVAL